MRHVGPSLLGQTLPDPFDSPDLVTKPNDHSVGSRMFSFELLNSATCCSSGCMSITRIGVISKGVVRDTISVKIIKTYFSFSDE